MLSIVRANFWHYVNAVNEHKMIKTLSLNRQNAIFEKNEKF